MQRTAIALSALLLITAIATPGATQELGSQIAASHQHDCGYVCIYALSVDRGEQSAQTRASHRQFAEAETTATSIIARAAVPRSSRVKRNEGSPPSQSAWMENPSLMGSSWWQWRSLTDF